MGITATLAAVGSAAAVAGTGYNIYNSQKQAGAQAAASYNQFRIGQAQSIGSDIQFDAQMRTQATQTDLLGLQRDQSLLSINTNKAVIGQQKILEQLKMEGNDLNQAFNARSRVAAVDIEQLNRQNDVINRQADVVDARQENLQRSLAYLQERRAQRQAIRQGVATSASGLVKGVASGVGTDSSATANVRAQAGNEASLAIQTAGQNRAAGISGVDLAMDKRLLGVQSRELGVNARGINYDLALGRYDLQDQQFDVNRRQFGVNDNISNIYLGAQDENAKLVNTAYGLNTQLLTENTDSQNALHEIQKQIYQLGGNNSLLSASAASFGGMASLGSGITSLGNSFINNASTLNKIAAEPTLQTFASSGPTGSGQGIFEWAS